MGCQSKPVSKVALPTANDEPTAVEQKAPGKAAKKVAKLAAAAEAEATIAVDGTDEEQMRLALKAAKKAAKLAAAAEAEAAMVDRTDVDAMRVAAKAAKKKAKAAAAIGVEANAEATEQSAKKKRKAHSSASEEVQPGDKRKLLARTDAERTNALALAPTEPKRRKDVEGKAVVVNVLGATAYRQAHQVLVEAQCPAPLETFDAILPSFGKTLAQALLAQGYAAPTPIQAQGWPIAMLGQDVVAVAKTGSGKTCGFLLPALARIAERGPQPRRGGFSRDPARPSVLVLAPTRELVQQIAGEADKFAHAVKARVVVLYGGVPKGEQVWDAKQGADIVIATPGRLLDLTGGCPERAIPPALTLENVSYLVLDEADRMLDMGFEPDIRKIAEQCKPSGKPEEGGGASGPLAGTKRQTLFFTATWPKAVQQTARSLTARDALHIKIGQGADGEKLSANPMVKQTVYMMEFHEKGRKLHDIIKAELGPGQTCIVFAGQKNVCDNLENEIRRNTDYGFKPWCRVIHSGKDQWVRDEALAQFRKLTAGTDDKRGILVATDVAARGLDIPGVAMVIVYDFGKSAIGDDTSVESYVHRIGRTGRAGKSGKAFVFFTKQDSGAPLLVDVLERAGQVVPAGLKSLSEAEWYKNMEKENKKNWYKRGSKGGSRGGSKGKSGGKGGGGDGKGKGGGKGGGKTFTGRGKGS